MLRRRIAKRKKAEEAKQPIDPSTIPEAKPSVPKPEVPAVETSAPDVTEEAAKTPIADAKLPVSPEAVAPQVPGPPEDPEVPVVPDAAGVPPESTTEDSQKASAETPDEASAPEAPPAPDEPSVPEAPAALEAIDPEMSNEPAAPPRPAFNPPPLPDPTPPPTRSTLPPSSPLAPDRVGTMVGGIDLGGTKIAAAVIGPDHEVISYRRRPTPDRGGPADVVRAMAVTMQEAARDAGIEAHQLRAVGVGSPGSVESSTGAVSGAGNLPGWDGRFQLGMALRDAIGTPVAVGNDVQVGTNAEYQLGAGAGFNSLLGVFWGTGVGGGIILDGKPWKGRGRAGEIGHMTVKRGGAKGLNGLNGTVEAYAGRKAMEAKAIREMKKGRESDLFKIMEKHGKTHLTSAIWAHARDQGDELAIELLNRAVKALSAGIASAVNLLDVDAVVIGGGLGVRFSDSLVQEIIDGMYAHLLNSDNPPAVRVAGLGDEGGVIGASLLVD